MYEQSKQSIEKDAPSGGYRKNAFHTLRDLANALAEVEQRATKHTVNTDLLNGVHTAHAIHKVASRKRAVVEIKDDNGKVLADNESIENELCRFQEAMQAVVD